MYALLGIVPSIPLLLYAVIFHKWAAIGGIPVAWLAAIGLLGIMFSVVVAPTREKWPASGLVSLLLLIGSAASGTALILLLLALIRNVSLLPFIAVFAVLFGLPTFVAAHYIVCVRRALRNESSSDA
jgi:hypothetical protein